MIEIMTFRLADGVDELAFRAVDEDVQVQFAYQQPGIIRRTLAEFMALVEQDSLAVERYEGVD